MARKKKRRKSRRKYNNAIFGFELNPEAKRGISVVFIFALAAIMFLSFFQIAGSLGVFLNTVLSQFFGFDRFFVPIVLIIIGATMLYPDRGELSTWNYLGFLFFFLSFNSTLNLLLIHREIPFTEDLSLAGGYLGEFLAKILPSLVGYLGALVIVIALLFISIMLIFNTSLKNIVGLHQHITGWLGELLHKNKNDDEDYDGDLEDLEDEELEEDEEETGEYEDEDTHDTFRRKNVEDSNLQPEGVLATKNRRQISIPLKLLKKSANKAQAGDIERNKEIIEKTFREFNINVEMGKTSVGPTVTQFTLRPSQGVKLSRILGLQNDLALALAAHPLRMEAPIPGKSLVGIEVPNTKVATVTLRDVMDTKNFKTHESILSIPLGKDVSGNVLTIGLDKMPHMLVAGATGSGKSVCLNAMIVSWLYQNGPDELKLILVDPKRVELTAYAGIPHLLVPPIINVDDTVNALKWAVREMDRRLDLLSKFGSRNITDYNKKVEERMPKIVIVIDELADLMTVSGREVEATIVRIAQMARAVGIHLVLATQRPSVDVITGLIKANIPGRIAFAVASQTDSRTILDVGGADKLLGRGDMLFTSADVSKPKRIQGAFLSSEEVEAVVAHLHKKGDPDYNMAVTEITKAGTVFDDEDRDELFDESVQIVIQAGKASTSFLQRRLRIGYSRAARIMDSMQDAGVIGEQQGSRAREILIENWPPGGSYTEGMPTAQDDYDEAYENEDRFENENENEKDTEYDSNDDENDAEYEHDNEDENTEEEEEEEEDVDYEEEEEEEKEDEWLNG